MLVGGQLKYAVSRARAHERTSVGMENSVLGPDAYGRLCLSGWISGRRL